MVFQHLSHEAVDTAADVGQQHENVGAVFLLRERPLDDVDLPANSAHTRDQFLFFL